MPTTASAPLAPEELQRIAGLRIAFGHQSVGGEIVKGIESIAAEGGGALQVREGREAMASPVFQHFKIGRNEFPEAKMSDFAAAMRDSVTGSADVALMKLCYIDFGADKDPDALARTYIATVDALAAAHPQTTYVPVTAPLTTIQTGPKAWLKRMLGKPLGGEAENLRRARFNAALRQHYAGTGRMFDLAAIESGSGAIHFEHDGQKVEALDPTITYDGGHLNEAGQRKLATALLRHIAQLQPAVSPPQTPAP